MGFFEGMSDATPTETENQIIEDEEMNEMPDDIYSDSSDDDYSSIDPDDYMAVSDDEEDDGPENIFESGKTEDEKIEEVLENIQRAKEAEEKAEEEIIEKPASKPASVKKKDKTNTESKAVIISDGNLIIENVHDITVYGLVADKDINITSSRINAKEITANSATITSDSVICSSVTCDDKFYAEGNTAIKGFIEAKEVVLKDNVKVKGDIKALKLVTDEGVKINGTFTSFREDQFDESIFE